MKDLLFRALSGLILPLKFNTLSFFLGSSCSIYRYVLYFLWTFCRTPRTNCRVGVLEV